MSRRTREPPTRPGRGPIATGRRPARTPWNTSRPAAGPPKP